MNSKKYLLYYDNVYYILYIMYHKSSNSGKSANKCK